MRAQTGRCHHTPLTATADGDDDDLIKERWRSLLYYRRSDIDMLAGVVWTLHITIHITRSEGSQ